MTEKSKIMNNLYGKDMFKKKCKKPTEQEGKKRQLGEPFLEEEIEKEIDDLEQIRENIEKEEVEEETSYEMCEEMPELKDAIEEGRSKLLAAHAEIENVRRRAQQDIEKAHKFALERFVKELLPVADSLEHAIVNAEKSGADAATIDGISLTMQSMLNVLGKFGVKQIDPLNKPFDPQYHEAMTMVAHPSAKPNTVIDVFQKGYELNGRLVRPARVVVSK